MWMIHIERIVRRVVSLLFPHGSAGRNWFIKGPGHFYSASRNWFIKNTQWLFLLQSEQTRHRRKRRFFDKLCVTNPVIVFSAGKVGSTSLHGALEKLKPFLHFHDYPISKYEKHFFYFRYKKSDYLEYLLPRYVRGDMSVPEETPVSGTRLKIISPIREPIGRDVSAFFEVGLWKHFRLTAGEANRNPQSIEFMLNLSNRELRDIYLGFYGSFEPGGNAMTRSIVTWHEGHLIPCLGIDVYARPFPKERVACYTNHKADLMIYDCSLDDEKKESLIKDFSGLDTLTMHHANVTFEKNVVIRQLCERFKQEVRFPEWYLETVFSSAYFRHFYTAQDEARLRRQWSEDS